MNLEKLLNDFKTHVETLDDNAIKQSIAGAVESSKNSSSLKYKEEIEEIEEIEER